MSYTLFIRDEFSSRTIGLSFLGNTLFTVVFIVCDIISLCHSLSAERSTIIIMVTATNNIERIALESTAQISAILPHL